MEQIMKYTKVQAERSDDMAAGRCQQQLNIIYSQKENVTNNRSCER